MFITLLSIRYYYGIRLGLMLIILNKSVLKPFRFESLFVTRT